MTAPAIFVDFDGTISLEDSTDALLSRFAEPSWLDVEAAWLRGEIGSRRCLAEQVALLRLTPSELRGFASGVALDPGFARFVALCRARHLPVTVVSDGFSPLVEGALRAAGLALPVVANGLRHEGDGRWAAVYPHARESCEAGSGNCKCATLLAPGTAEPPDSVLIGDGRSDFCAAGTAKVVFAKGRLLRHCRENGIACHPFRDFDEVTDALPDVLDLRSARVAACTAPMAERRA